MAGLFAKLTAIFDAPEAAPVAAHDPTAVAMAALMIQLARADGHYDEDERAGIKAALDARFGDGEALLAAGEAADNDLVTKVRDAGVEINEADKDAFIAASAPIYKAFSEKVSGGDTLVSRAQALAD